MQNEYLSLLNFEDFIEKKIIGRGRDYYYGGNVTELEEEGENRYVASVEGSEDYRVEVRLDGKNRIVDSTCDCPYDLGEYCKHQAAVFYALRELRLKTPGKERPRPKKQSLKEILEGLDKSELIEIIMELAENREIKNALLLKYSTDADELTACKKLISASVKKYSRRGFVEWDDVGNAVEGAIKVLDILEAKIRSGRAEASVEICMLLLSEMMKLLDACDDSDGIVGDIIRQSIEMMEEAAQNAAESPDAGKRKEIFLKIIKEAENRRYDGWTDWRLDILGGCAWFCGEAGLRSTLEARLEKIFPQTTDDWGNNYLAARIQLLRLQIIRLFDPPEQAEAFVRENIRYSEFRELAINASLEKGECERVLELCADGIKRDAKYAGLVHKWKEYCFKAYEQLGDKDRQRALALEFVYSNEYGYFEKLKNLCGKNEWPSVLNGILNKFEEKAYPPDIYVRILIHEKLTKKLLAYCQRNISRIVQLYPYIVPEFQNEVGEIFIKYIEESAQAASDRKAYKKVCEIIRACQKACGNSEAEKIRRRLMENYPRRPAFLEELSGMR